MASGNFGETAQFVSSEDKFLATFGPEVLLTLGKTSDKTDPVK